MHFMREQRLHVTKQKKTVEIENAATTSSRRFEPNCKHRNRGCKNSNLREILHVPFLLTSCLPTPFASSENLTRQLDLISAKTLLISGLFDRNESVAVWSLSQFDTKTAVQQWLSPLERI